MRTVSKMVEEITILKDKQYDDVVKDCLQQIILIIKDRIKSGDLHPKTTLNADLSKDLIFNTFNSAIKPAQNNVFASKQVMEYLAALMETNRKEAETLIRGDEVIPKIFTPLENRERAIALIQSILAISPKKSEGLEGMRNTTSRDSLELLGKWQKIVTKRLESPFMGIGFLQKERDDLNSFLYKTIKNMNIQDPSSSSIELLELAQRRAVQAYNNELPIEENKKRL